MAAEETPLKKVGGDKYRSFLDEGVQWRHGALPSYEDANKLFEEGRTKVISSQNPKIYALYSLLLLLPHTATY